MTGWPLGRRLAALALTGAVLAGCGSSGGGASSTTTTPGSTTTTGPAGRPPVTKPSATSVAPAQTTPATKGATSPATTPTHTTTSSAPTTTTRPVETPLARCLRTVASRAGLSAAQRKLLDEVCVKIGGVVHTGTTR